MLGIAWTTTTYSTTQRILLSFTINNINVHSRFIPGRLSCAYECCLPALHTTHASKRAKLSTLRRIYCLCRPRVSAACARSYAAVRVLSRARSARVFLSAQLASYSTPCTRFCISLVCVCSRHERTGISLSAGCCCGSYSDGSRAATVIGSTHKVSAGTVANTSQ